MNYFYLLKNFLRISILNEMQYRANFVLQVLDSGIALAVNLFWVSLLFNYTQNINGWNRFELVAVIGVHTLVSGLIKTFVDPNMQKLVQDVQKGTLDYALTKPEDAQLLVSARETRIWQLTDVLLGLMVLGYAVVQLQSTVGLLQVLMFIGMLMLGMAMVYSAWLIFTTSVFWFTNIQDLFNIFEGFLMTGTLPVSVYPGWLRGMLTFVIPIAFAITVPAEALTGRLTLPTVLLALALAVGLLVAARLIWRLGLRRYSGASA